jgi:Alpha-(1->3)-arabinofuranosyltransferase
LTAPTLTRDRRARSPGGLSGAFRSAIARLGSRIPPVALAYAVPSLVAAVSVQTWFRGDAALASGDLAPPVAPGSEYRAHWSGFETGAGAPGYPIVSLPYYEGLRLFSWLGFGEAAFQRLWLTVLLAGTAAAVVFLARGLVSSPIAAAVAGFVPLFSAYRLTLAFDPVPLMAMIAAAVLGGLVIRAGGEAGPHPLVFGLASLLCAFVFVNPPHLALVIVWVAISGLLAWAAHGGRAPRRVGRFLLVGIPLALLFNLWWIVPAVLTITGSLFDERFAAAAVDDWAWTHVRGNLLNVVSFTSLWSWPYPEYYPFSGRLERAPFTALQYVPAVAAVLGLVLVEGRRRIVALVLAVVGALAIWVMKGLHDPLAGTNEWFYDNMPGFWLLREPTKTGLVLVLVFALLAALAISRLVSLSRRVGVAAAALVVAGGAVYAHPLLTGAVVPTERPLLPSAHVHVPSGWRAAAAYLERRPDGGKVVVLPRLDYYQAPTTWGYYGASFLHHLINRPVIEPLAETYFRDPVVDSLVGQLEAEVLGGQGNVTGVLQALGARYVVLRRDLDTAFPDRSFVSPLLLERRLAGVGGLRRLRGFRQAVIYEAPGVQTPEVYPAVPLIQDGSGLGAVRGTLEMAQNAALVQPEAGGTLDGISTGQTLVVQPKGPGELLAVDVERDAVVLRPLGGKDGGASRPALVSVPAPEPPFAVIVGSRRFAVSESGDARRLAVVNPADLPAGRTFYRPEPLAFRPSHAERVGDCNKYDDRSLEEAGISAGITGSGDGATLRLRARYHSACVAIPIDAARAGTALHLQLLYRGVTGNSARLCLWQEGPDRCGAVPPLDASPGWHRFDETLTPAAGTEAAFLFLYADGDPGGRRATETEYRRVTVAAPAPDVGLAVKPLVRLPEISYRRTAPGEFRVRVRGADHPFVLVAAETFAPGWRIEASGRDTGDVTHFRVNGYANGWRIPWTGSYELTIFYRPDRFAQAARRLDLVAIPIGVLALFLGPIRGRRKNRRGSSGRERM